MLTVGVGIKRDLIEYLTMLFGALLKILSDILAPKVVSKDQIHRKWTTANSSTTCTPPLCVSNVVHRAGPISNTARIIASHCYWRCTNLMASLYLHTDLFMKWLLTPRYIWSVKYFISGKQMEYFTIRFAV